MIEDCCATAKTANNKQQSDARKTFNENLLWNAQHIPPLARPVTFSDTIETVEFLYKLVEERIKKAQEEGIFDNLQGQGKPLKLDDDAWIPEDLRLTYKILKNANCLPIELELRKEIFNLHQLLDAAIDPETRRNLRRELNLAMLKLDVRRKAL